MYIVYFEVSAKHWLTVSPLAPDAGPRVSPAAPDGQLHRPRLQLHLIRIDYPHAKEKLVVVAVALPHEKPGYTDATEHRTSLQLDTKLCV